MEMGHFPLTLWLCDFGVNGRVQQVSVLVRQPHGAWVPGVNWVGAGVIGAWWVGASWQVDELKYRYTMVLGVLGSYTCLAMNVI